MKWENGDFNAVEWVNIPKFPPLLNGDQEKLLFCGMMECLTLAVSFDTFLTISNLFVCLTALQLTTLEQQVCSTTQMHYHWEQKAS